MMMTTMMAATVTGAGTATTTGDEKIQPLSVQGRRDAARPAPRPLVS
jgi:hypothetical protein